MKTALQIMAIAYLAVIALSAAYYGWKERMRQRRRIAARFEAIRLGTRPVEFSTYSAWGLLYELETKDGKRNAEYLRMQLGEPAPAPRKRTRNQHP